MGNSLFLRWGMTMKKKHKKHQIAPPVPEPKLENSFPAVAGCVQINDIVTRRPISLIDKDGRACQVMSGRVIWIHPLGRFHVVEFGEGQRAIRESFMGVRL